MFLAETLLHGMKILTIRQALDRLHLGAVRLHGKDGAGFYRAPIEMHRTRAALAGVATDMGSGERELLAKEINQECSWFDHGIVLDTVDGDADRHRGVFSLGSHT
jgi:hypothetical protein